MKILAILGPLGSGKTTLVNKILATFPHLRTLVVVNDVGTKNIDARRIKNAVGIKELTAGCIGCSDLPAFKKVIGEAKGIEDLDLLLIEPTGIADGREIHDAIVSSGCEFRAITLVDVKHFERNRALGCMESQLEVATTVALTWINEQEVPASVYEFIGHHAPGRPIVELDNIATIVAATLEIVVPKTTHTHDEHCSCGHDHTHHHHKHDHPHDGDHGVFSFSVMLRDEVMYLDIIAVIAPYLDSLVRAKGVVSGRLFDYVQGDICQGERSSDAPHGNFIFNRYVRDVVFDPIAKKPAVDTRSKKERMRSVNVPLEATLAAIEWQLKQYPPVTAPSGILRVDCEADVVYQLAKRPGVPEDVRKTVLRRYVSWRIEAAQRLMTGDWKGHPDEPYWQRRLGVNLGYMCAVYSKMIGDDLVNQVADIRPAEMLAKGLLGLSELSFDEEKAEEKPETVAKAFSFSKVDVELVRHAVTHCLTLSTQNPAWHARWKKVCFSTQLG